MLLLVVLAAGFLRLGWPRVVSFGYDEARVSRLALEMARQGRLVVVGIPTSAGVPNFPAAVWLYAIPYALSSDPLIAVWFTAVANVLAVVGVWWLARQAWDPWTAVAAAALCATSPYLVFYSRGIWGQNWLVPGAVLWAVCVVKGLQVKSDRWVAGAAFLAGFVGQIHPAGFALAVMMAWVVVRFRLWHRWRGLAIGGALAALSALPMVLQLLSGSGEVGGHLRMLGQKASLSRASLAQLVQLVTSQGWAWFWSGPNWRASNPLTVPLGWVSVILAVTTLAGLLTVAREWWQSRARGAGAEQPGGGVLGAVLVPWAVVPPLLFLWSWTPPYIQYQLAAVPALYLVAGAVPRSISRPRLRGALGVVLLAMVAVQVAAVSHTLSSFQRQHLPGGLGTPLLYAQAAANELRAEGQTVVIEAAGSDPAFDGDAAVFDVLLWHSEHRLVDARVALLLPEKGANVLFTFETLPAWDVANQLGVGVQGSLPRREGEPPYATLRVAPPYELALTAVGPVRLSNGAELIGWTMRTLPDGGRRLITAWRIGQRVAGQYHQFNHLYLEGTAGPAAVHDIDAQSAWWQQGDLLITWADFAPIEGRTLRWEVGMYTYPDIVRVPLEDSGAQDSIKLLGQP